MPEAKQPAEGRAVFVQASWAERASASMLSINRIIGHSSKGSRLLREQGCSDPGPWAALLCHLRQAPRTPPLCAGGPRPRRLPRAVGARRGQALGRGWKEARACPSSAQPSLRAQPGCGKVPRAQPGRGSVTRARGTQGWGSQAMGTAGRRAAAGDSPGHSPRRAPPDSALQDPARGPSSLLAGQGRAAGPGQVRAAQGQRAKHGAGCAEPLHADGPVAGATRTTWQLRPGSAAVLPGRAEQRLLLVLKPGLAGAAPG